MQTSTSDSEFYNLEAEEQVLGAFLICPELLYQVEIRPELFYRQDHARLYEAMLKLFIDGVKPDFTTIRDLNPQIEYSLINRVLRETVTAANIHYHTRIVRDKWERRRYRRTLAELQGKLMGEDFKKEAERALLDLQETPWKREVSMADTLKAIFADIEAAGKRESVGVQTGFRKLNEHCVGICKKHLWLLGAYTSHGKSTLLSQVLADTCDNGSRALVFSVEDSKQDKITRLLATKTGIPIRTIIRGDLKPPQWTRITAATGDIAEYGIEIYDDCYHLDEIELKIKKHKLQGGVDVVYIDFVQNLLTGGESIYDRMSEVAIRLQRMAKKYEVGMFALSQVSEGKEKGSINLRGAQELASAADIVLWIDRKPDHRDFDLVIRKNRPFGKTGRIAMEFSEEWTNIREH